ncbi:MAG: BTAD domain-containing putative transcriptional regulator [Trueperaceae bacterium]
MAGPFRIATFGGLRVSQSGGPEVAGLGAKTTAAVLVYLAASRRAVPRAHLAELFWPEQPEAVSRTNLRSILHRLRRALGDDLQTPPQAVLLSDRVQLDATEFDEHVRRGRLEEAWNLYRGEFLNGFYLDHSPTFESWMAGEQVRYASVAIDVGQQLLSQAVAAGNASLSTELARGLLALDPVHEVALHTLLRLTAARGRRKAALELFDDFRQRLLDELDAEPSAATLQLVADIESGRIDNEALPAGPGPGAAVPAEAPAPVTESRFAATEFVGRAEERAELAKLLARDEVRLVTLHGPGGTGKSRLAQRVMEDVTAAYSRSTFVALEDVQTDGDVPPRIAARIGVDLGLESEPLDRIVRALRDERALLVLDNLEHLNPAVVEHLLAGCPRLTVLATSRERLGLTDEHVYSLGGLALTSDAESPAGAALSDAETLFVQRARQVVPDFASAGPEREALGQLCSALSGSPLAIELAAAWTRLMTCSEILAELRQSLDLLGRRAELAGGRHGSMRAVFEASWRRLAYREQRVLAGVAVFEGGFLRDAAGAVCGAGATELGDLVDRSLLQVRGAKRFRLHPLARQFALEKLSETPDHEATVRERHGRWYLRFAREHEEGLWFVGRPQTLAKLEPELANMKAAWRWAVRTRELDELAATAWAFDSIFQHHLRQAHAVFAEAVAGLDERDPEHRPVLAHLLTYLAHFEVFEPGGNSRATAERALALLEPLDDEVGTMRALVRWGFSEAAQGRQDEALAHWQRGLELARRVGTARDLSVYLTIITGLESARLKPAEADEFLEGAISEVERFGTAVHLTHMKRNAGWHYLGRGDQERADALFEEAHALARELGIGRLEPFGYLVQRALEAADLEVAEEHARRAVSVLKVEGTRNEELAAIYQLAHVQLQAERPAEAFDTLLRFVLLALETPDNAAQLASAVLLLCDCAVAQGTPVEAAPFIGAAEALEPPAPLRAQLDERAALLQSMLGEGPMQVQVQGGRRLGLAGLLQRANAGST